MNYIHCPHCKRIANSPNNTSLQPAIAVPDHAIFACYHCGRGIEWNAHTDTVKPAILSMEQIRSWIDMRAQRGVEEDADAFDHALRAAGFSEYNEANNIHVGDVSVEFPRHDPRYAGRNARQINNPAWCVGCNPNNCSGCGGDPKFGLAKPNAADLMERALQTYRERNLVYGNSYHRFGDVMLALFPEGLPKEMSRDDWNRLGVLNMIVSKLIRYATNFKDGGHADSAHDIGVYAFMLEELNEVPF